jgi:glucosamine-6-phosphate deaminase
MEAKKILLLASGDSKAEPIAKAIEGPITSMCTASAIQMHPNTIVIIDEAAAKFLKEKDYYKWVYSNSKLN